MHRKHPDLIATMALAVFAAACVLLGAPGADIALVRGIGVVAGASLAFVLPGYALVAALLAGRSPGRAELALLSVGGSVALAVVAGLLLNLTPWGLRPQSWAVALGAVAVECGLIAEWRRASVSGPPLPASSPSEGRWVLTSRAAVLYGLASLVVALAVSVASVTGSTTTAATPRTTRLWVVPATAGSAGVRLGVENGEAVTVRYALRVGSGSGIVDEWPDLVLAPGERWEVSLSFAAVPGEDRTVEALLYRDDDPDVPYRSVTVAVR